ncbi:unnamed protein product [Ilex paraguariensis]|uniref:Uncharacterized protein n=1 Tax=Ilex paraguariensis TaxID=185542 RepID=A0ABC8TX36_9AQUA
MNRTIRPTDTDIISGKSLAPWRGFDSVSGSLLSGGGVEAEAALIIGFWVLVGFGRELKRKGMGLRRVREEREWGDRRAENGRIVVGFEDLVGGDLERKNGGERDRMCEETREGGQKAVVVEEEESAKLSIVERMGRKSVCEREREREFLR